MDDRVKDGDIVEKVKRKRNGDILRRRVKRDEAWFNLWMATCLGKSQIQNSCKYFVSSDGTGRI